MDNSLRFFSKDKSKTNKNDSRRIYVLTAYEFNHAFREALLDDRFNSDNEYVFYFFDQDIDLTNFPLNYKKENTIFPEISNAGKKHFAEWSFFLTEYHKKILEYPFYAISSRFYEKNTRLEKSLDFYWENIFRGLETYGYGYLPSYNRDISFIDMHDYFSKGRLGYTPTGQDFIAEVFGVDMRHQYRYVSDYWCNYIGFASREHFERYMEFYMPLFDQFFDANFNLKKNYGELGIVNLNAPFRELKPLSLLLEQVSHMFFYKNKIPFFGLHYDGTYEIREFTQELIKLQTCPKEASGAILG